MTHTYPNRSPIGAAYVVGDRTFPARTPRGILADALQDEGRTWEAELLRSPDPVVLGHPVRHPHVGDVVEALHRLLPEIRTNGWPLVARPGGASDAVEMVFPVQYPHGAGYGLQRFRWPASDTSRVYTVLRTRKPGALRDPWQLGRKLRGSAVPMEVEQLDENGVPTEFLIHNETVLPLIPVWLHGPTAV